MAAEIQTTSSRLATMIQDRNPGSTCVESGGTWTVNHADELIITAHIARRAGYNVDYPEARSMSFSDAGSPNISDIKSSGYIWLWTPQRIVIKDGSDTDASYSGSLQASLDLIGQESYSGYTATVRLARSRGGAIPT